MKEIGISMQLSDLKNPNEERYKIIYTQILAQLSGVDVNRFQQNQYQSKRCQKMFAFPELHENSIGQIVLILNLIKFMQRVGVKDFCMSDLISPEPNRTIRNLSAIINFAKFRVTKSQLYDKIKSKETGLSDEFAAQRTQNQTLAKKFQDFQNKLVAQKPQIDILQEEINSLKFELNKFSNDCEILQHETRESKRIGQELKANQSSNKLQLNKLTDEIANLENHIVKSPQKIRQV